MTRSLIPSPEKQKISRQLQNHIIDLIDQQGPLPFSDYMHQALYHPRFGYYRNGLAKFGKEGDFITAPEISPLFGYCLANQCQQIIQSSAIDTVFEFGAGSGQLACDLLTHLNALGTTLKQYLILEPCAELQERQYQKIKQHHPEMLRHVHWLSTLPDHPIEAIIIANEVLDAMPVTKFAFNKGHLTEISVTQKKHELHFHPTPAKPELHAAVNALELTHQPEMEHYESEINLWIPLWIAALNRCLRRGVILIIDYGFPQHEFYHPARDSGTIMCHFEHQAHSNPLILPGIQDVTAHVDFTAIAQAATENELELAGYTHQAAFLNNCGLLALRNATDAVTQYTQAQQIKMLTLASEMGELFKVIGLQKKLDLDLLGFTAFDLSYRL